MKNYQSLVDALDDLRKRGYDADFEPQSNSLYCDELDMRLNEEEFHMDEVYHFKGGPGPEDNAVVYALTSNTGVRGTVVYEFGASADNSNFDLTKKIKNYTPGVAN